MSLSFAALMGLAPPDILELLDVAAILQAKIDDLVARYPDAADFIGLESEPLRKSLEENAYRELILRQRINEVFRQTLLAEATGSNLTVLAAFYDVTRLAGEDDAHLRERTVMEIAGRSPAGTAERYRAKALGASIHVRDAVVWRDELTPTIRIAVFSDGPGGVADSALLATVSAALTDDAVKVVSDSIEVVSAVTAVQPVAATVWLLPATAQSVFEGLSEALQAAWAAEAGLGFNLTRAWLTARLMQAGVQRVEITAPAADIAVNPHQALALGAITLTYGGRDA